MQCTVMDRRKTSDQTGRGVIARAGKGTEEILLYDEWLR